MKCTYLINMDNGALEFRDEVVEKQINLKPIPDEVTKMILSGEVSAMDVVNAISAKVKESGDFNLSEYLEGMKRLNVRKSNRQEAPTHDPLPDVDDAISVDEVKAAKEKAASDGKAAKRERIKKVNAALDDELKI